MKKIQNSLKHAHEMIEEGRLSKASEILTSLEPTDNCNEQQKAVFYTLRSKLEIFSGNRPKAYEMAEKGMLCARNIKICLEVVDAFVQMAYIYISLGKGTESKQLLTESDEILQNLPQISEKDRQQRKGIIYIHRGIVLFQSGEFRNSIKDLEEGIELLKKWGGSKANIVQAYAFYGNMHMILGEIKKARKILTISQKMLENEESPQFNLAKIITLIGIGSISMFRGDFKLAMESTKKGIALARECHHRSFVYGGLNNLGGMYRILGDWDQAIKYLKEALALAETNGIPSLVVGMLDTFFHIYIAIGDVTEAQQIFHRIEQYWTKDKEQKVNNLIYQVAKATLLKRSNRTRDLGIAQDIFKTIALGEIAQIEMTQIAILSLCEMLLDEFKTTNNDEVLEECCSFLTNLQEAAEKQNAYPILAESYVLDAQMSMLRFDLNKARQSLTKAQQIAGRYGLKLLAIKISNEHDNLLQNLEVWEQMEKDNVPMSERMEKTPLRDQLSTMLKQKPIEIPDTSSESPMVLLIMAKSGLPLYTKIFSKDWKFSEGLFSGFLSAFNNFSAQIFSEGLDRANFGKFTILMTGLPPFRSCYVYEGHSFLAQQKFSQFNASIQKSEQIWQKLTSADRSGQIIRGDPGEGLGQLVQTIF
ncbi:MAG: tetratricopeptide repeat protein [Promethearchaeota archaeon]